MHCISIESNQNLPLEVNLYNLKCLNIYDLRLKKATIKLRNEIIVANILIKIGGINFELNSLINLFIKILIYIIFIWWVEKNDVTSQDLLWMSITIHY